MVDTLEENSYFKIVVKDAISDLKHNGSAFLFYFLMSFLLGWKPPGGSVTDVPCAQCVSGSIMVSGLVRSQENHGPGE